VPWLELWGACRLGPHAAQPSGSCIAVCHLGGVRRGGSWRLPQHQRHEFWQAQWQLGQQRGHHQEGSLRVPPLPARLGPWSSCALAAGSALAAVAMWAPAHT
jgi:hypothetical protein